MTKINEFQLASGRNINLIGINQRETYAGFLEGMPTKEINQLLIKEAVEAAKQLWNEAPYLIEPIETPIIWKREYPLGIPASIPGKVCISQLRSFYPRGENMGLSGLEYSLLTLVWFQDEFAFPIDDSILEKIHSLDWDRYATDCQY
jgi:hypothetical protein